MITFFFVLSVRAVKGEGSCYNLCSVFFLPVLLKANLNVKTKQPACFLSILDKLTFVDSN